MIYTQVGNCCSVEAVDNTTASAQRAERKFVPSHIAEVVLETAIEVAKQRLCEAETWEEKLDAWREMVRLIDQRSPSRVRFMERMRGLG